ncbi:MAG TPA: hypothetical protein VF331_07845, partial [Polyangiales bacterium]
MAPGPSTEASLPTGALVPALAPVAGSPASGDDFWSGALAHALQQSVTSSQQRVSWRGANDASVMGFSTGWA